MLYFGFYEFAEAEFPNDISPQLQITTVCCGYFELLAEQPEVVIYELIIQIHPKAHMKQLHILLTMT